MDLLIDVNEMEVVTLEQMSCSTCCTMNPIMSPLGIFLSQCCVCQILFFEFLIAFAWMAYLFEAGVKCLEIS